MCSSDLDIQRGDVLLTSGIDGVYPTGLAVATVVSVDAKTSDAFARILLQPTAGIARHRQLLVLLADAKQMPAPAPPPPVETPSQPDPRKRRKETETP